MPQGVHPDTPEGRYYRELIEHVRADIAAAPPLTDAQIAYVIPILRGARDAAA